MSGNMVATVLDNFMSTETSSIEPPTDAMAEKITSSSAVIPGGENGGIPSISVTSNVIGGVIFVLLLIIVVLVSSLGFIVYYMMRRRKRNSEFACHRKMGALYRIASNVGSRLYILYM